MPCFRSLRGYRASSINASGKRSIVFKRKDALWFGLTPFSQVTLPCGKCMHCRLEHSRQWALRSVHESKAHALNCFITLTYAPEHLPAHGSLDYQAPVLFMKRLRDRISPDTVRSYGCAEYGTQLQRPHYHLCLFGYDFPDKKIHSKSHTDYPLFTSALLSELWPYGHSSIGAFNFETAAYVARYVTKKISGPPAPGHYDLRPDPVTGEIHTRLPERAICVSRRPGLGRTWYESNRAYVHHHDQVVLRGHKMRPPKYYDRLFDLADPEGFALTKAQRQIGGKIAAEKMSNEDEAARQKRAPDAPLPELRIHVLERCKELAANLLKRGFENG